MLRGDAHAGDEALLFGHDAHSHADHPTEAQSADDEEAACLQQVVRTFQLYLPHSIAAIRLLERDFAALEPRHQRLVPAFAPRMAALKRAAATNNSIVQKIVAPHVPLFGGRAASLPSAAVAAQSTLPSAQLSPNESNWDKLKSTLRQIVRDWTSEGQRERDACYAPMIEWVRHEWPPERVAPGSVRILCPGSGLGRLPWEFARLGHTSTGNEWSYFMLLASNFVLNCVERPLAYEIHPFIHQSANVVSGAEQLRAVRFPDVDVSAIPPGTDFSMCAGDFVEVFGQHEAQWECIATPFFIDTARNVVEYIEVIARALVPGGLWINCGPLLWHWSGMPNEMSVELTYEEVKGVIAEAGLVIEDERPIECFYTTNPHSMMQTLFRCQFFVARKPAVAHSPPAPSPHAAAAPSHQ